MNAIAMLLGMSVDIGPIGSFLSGIFSRSPRRAVIWIGIWIIVQIALGVLASPVSDHFLALRILLCVFWGGIGWFFIGRARAKERNTAASLKQ